MKKILRHLAIALLFAVMITPAMQAQTAAPTTSATTPFGLAPLYNAADQLAFNAAYAASLPPALKAYMALPYSQADFGTTAATLTRTTPSVLLQAAGQFSLDTQIAVWGQDPYMTDLVRIVQGYTWVPSFGQANIPVGPGLSIPTSTYVYNPAAPPAGAIIVPLVNATTGKMVLPLPYAAPVTAAPITSTDPVGFLEMPFGAAGGIGDWYSVVTGDASPLLTVVVDSRGTFEKEAEGQANIITGTVSVFWVRIK
jgi:hypothetical protein